MKDQGEYKRGWEAAIASAACFLVQAHDEPTLATELRKYVGPNRNWRQRLNRELIADAKGERKKR